MSTAADDADKIKADALEFIRSQTTMVVATASSSGIPEAATIYFDVDDDFTFYFLTADTSKKYQNLGQNGQIAIVIGAGSALSTVQGGGRVYRVDRVEKVAEANDIIARVFKRAGTVNHQEFPIVALPHIDYGAFILKPSWLRWLSLEKNTFPEAYAHGYHQLIP
jgi:uncharacterized pyridoxamine 5'-phosphate oxidase family protein